MRASWRDNRVAEILLGKLLDGHRASFVRSDGELFVVSVDGQERKISQDAWRLLPEQQVLAADRGGDMDDHHRRTHGG
jgi:hypothetical protein